MGKIYKILILVMVLFSPITVQAGVSPNQAKIIFERLNTANGNKFKPLIIEHSEQINAWANLPTGQITITTAMLKYGNQAEIALILGHEMGHVTSGPSEDVADHQGARITSSAGYSVCEGRYVFKKFYRDFGKGTDGVHSDNRVRFDNLTKWGGCSPENTDKWRTNSK